MLPRRIISGIDSAVPVAHHGVMKYISINETKNHLSRLLRRVAAGEEIVIARRGTPIARIDPLAPSERRHVGIDKGRVTVPTDFSRPIEEDGRDQANL